MDPVVEVAEFLEKGAGVEPPKDLAALVGRYDV